ncbi:MAG: hypothetical protein K6B28_07280 [Lachnospiraceae bacterium]|nr:hypothetical protein [Lachnospiraceae bacterium]
MKKNVRTIVALLIMISVFALFGCSAETEPVKEEAKAVEETAESSSEDVKQDTVSGTEEAESSEEVSEEPEVTVEAEEAEEETEDTTGDLKENAADKGETDEAVTEDEGNTKDNDQSGAGLKGSTPTIVWLGDSLTQGSLGDMDDNLPNAPYEKLKQLSGANVEGYGYYAFKTEEILWSYTAENVANQVPDPEKIYVFWVGSNDFVHVGSSTNTDVDFVADQIDKFVTNNALDKYIVLGTTSRWELRENEEHPRQSDIINRLMSERYGDRFLNVDTILNDDTSYVFDSIHLTQEAYDGVAALVYEKLKSMGYL